jgi:hypothetical protein
MFFVSLLDHSIIAWWLEEAMPITSTENTVGQYILYHHGTIELALYRDLLTRIDGSD